jgi:drug/metabolite transporter (DMT)-like permease
VRSSFS